KATERQLTERTVFTQYGQIIGTLQYMSPEQAEASQLGVDTRSDIYSPGYRLRKLAGKYRMALGIAGLFLGLLMLVGAVSAWQAVRARQAELYALAERDRAAQEKDRAEASFRMARDTVDRFFTQVGESPQLKAQGMEKFRRGLLQNAKEFYER